MLGFHLAGCPACRAYRDALQQALLIRLLEQPHTAAAQPRLKAPTPQRPQRTLATWLGLGLVLLILSFVGRISYAAWSLRSNVQAYIIETPAQPLPTAPPSSDTQPEMPYNPAQAIIPQKEAQIAVATPIPQQSSISQQPSLVPIVPTSVAYSGNLIPTLGPAVPTLPLAAGGDAVTVLILGSDRRPGETSPSRTDTIMLANIDPLRQRIALLSLPRDMIVEIPGYGYGRINSAYVYGNMNTDPATGMALARTTISRLIDTPIDYAVLVDFEGFIGLIDAIGGIDIDVPEPLYDNAYPTMDYGYMEIYFEAGPQHMDGARALEYARIRHADSDFQRIRRQQSIVVQVVEQLSSKNIVVALDQAVTASAALRGYVWTDMPEDRMLSLAWSLRTLKAQQIERFVVDENTISFNGVGGGCSSADDYWAECVHRGALSEIVQEWLSGIKK